MNALAQKIAQLIEATGPIPVADYMALCLFDPQHGYYTSRQPFGAGGDFITAPEVSQMFGELLGIWTFSVWHALGRPSPVTIAEIGPGRGTLMKDVLRTLARLDPGIAAKIDVALVETSPALAEVQKTALAASGFAPLWHETIHTLPARPLVILGNELLDAIPVRQYVRAGGTWRERVVALDGGGHLHFAAGAGSLDPALLPPEGQRATEGSIFEIAPARTALLDAVAGRIAAHGGAALFVDYGHLHPGLGDTLQAIRKHRYEDALENPGEADLTSHVDFSALAPVARAKGLDVHLATQADFLLGLGLLERAGRLGEKASQADRERISGEVERLAGADAMGNLFKVMAILPRGLAVPPFSAAS